MRQTDHARPSSSDETRSGRSALHVARSDEAALHVVQTIAPTIDTVAVGLGFRLGGAVVVAHAMELHRERGAVEEGQLGELARALARGVHGAGIHEVFAIGPQPQPAIGVPLAGAPAVDLEDALLVRMAEE